MTAVAAPVVTARVFVTKAHWVRALPGFRSSATAVLITSTATTMATVSSEPGPFTKPSGILVHDGSERRHAPREQSDPTVASWAAQLSLLAPPCPLPVCW